MLYPGRFTEEVTSKLIAQLQPGETAVLAEIDEEIAHLKAERKERIADLKEKIKEVAAKIKSAVKGQKATKLRNKIEKHQKKIAALEQNKTVPAQCRGHSFPATTITHFTSCSHGPPRSRGGVTH